MNSAQRIDVDSLIGTLQPFQPQNLKVEEKSKQEVLITYQLDNIPNGMTNWFWFGNWDGEKYLWQFQYDGMPEN